MNSTRLSKQLVLAAVLVFFSTNLVANDLSETKWSGTWKDERWGNGKASLIITEDLGDAWEALWRDGSGIRYRSKFKVTKNRGSVTIEGTAKGRLRTIQLKGKLTGNRIVCSYTGRDCVGTVTVTKQ